MSSLSPLPSEADALSNAAFEELMWATSRPGLVRDLPSAGLEPLAKSLIDRECSYHVMGSIPLDAALALTGSRPAPLAEADYIFASSLSAPEQVSALNGLRKGSLAYPDAAATLFAPAHIGSGQALKLSGPGINGSITIEIGNVDPSFWSMREKAIRYPLGWDLYLIDAAALIGIPRSTKVEVF
ncbi:MAG: phosphonate C-P lyase system protein PhnH [Rhizobiaceae bacterium]|nr:phosphonate C-P lyase system protein PhnH [Rhizobiaceae bacterium]